MKRRILIAAVACVALLVALPIGGLLYINTEAGRNWLARTIEDAVSEPGVMEVKVGDIAAGLPGDIAIASLTVADRDGIWLTLDDLAVHWDPWALLSRRLAVDRIELAGATVSRAPVSDTADEASDDEADSASILPELPVDIVIDDLVVTQLDLGTPLLGQSASLTVDAALSANRDGTVALDLDVTRTDGVGATFQAKADIDLADDLLSLSANVQEPEGGVIVRMLDLAPYPAFNLALEGEGPASAWSGRLTANAGDLMAMDINADVASAEKVTVSLQGIADIAQLLPSDARALVGDAVTLDTTVVIGDESYTIDHLDAEARALALSMDGVVDLSAETVDARANLTSRDNDPIEALAAPLQLEAWQFDVTAIGSIEAPELTLNGTVNALDMPDAGGGDVTVAAKFVPVAADGWRGEAQIVIEGAGIAEPTAQDLLGDRIQIDFAADTDVDFARLSTLSLVVAGAGLDLRASGDIDLTDLSGEVLVDATVADAAVFSDELGLPLRGGLGLQTELTIAPDLARLSGTVDVVGDEFAVDDPSIAAFVGQRFDLAIGLDTDLASQILLDDLTLKTEALDVAGHVDITDGFTTVAGRLDGPLTITPAVADLLGVDTGGQILVDARFEGPLEGPVIKARTQLEGVAAAGISLDGATIAAELRELASSPTGEALVTLPTSAGPMKIAASFLEADGAIGLPVIALNGAGMTGNGSIRITEAGIAVGSLQGTFDSLAPVAGLADVPADGAATFRVDLAADEAGGQGATVALNTIGLSFASGEDGLLTVEEIRIQARLVDLAGEPGGQVDLSLGGAVFDTYVIDGAVMRADMTGGVAAVDLQAEGHAGVPVSIDLAVQADTASDDLVLVFDRLQGSLGDEPFNQAENLRVAFVDDSIAVQGIALDLGGGLISGSLGRTPQTVDAEVAIKQLPVNIIRIVVPEADVAGLIDGQIAITTQGGAVVGTIDVTASDVDLSKGGGNQNLPADIVISADLTERDAVANVTVSGLPGSELEGEIRIGTAIDAASLEARNAMSAPLEATLDVNVNLADLWETLPVSDQRLSGSLVAAMSASGTVGDPSVAGQVTLGNGTYEHLIYGTLIDQINLTVTGDSTSNLDIAMQARDGGSGTIEANGDIDLGDEIGIQATLSLNDATLVRRDDVTASAGGDLRYSGSATDGLIDGTITTNTIEINLVNSLPPSVVDLDAQDVFGDKGNAGTTTQASVWAADLDITIDMPRRVFVRGRGVETEWFGQIAITGTTDTPIIDGRLEIQRGEVSLIGRPFEITRGVVELDPEQPDNPSLDIVAQNQRGDVTGIITVSGRALDPTIDISSTPPLPQAEVLPRVLFGKSSSNLSAFEAFELASAVAELSGVGGGSSIIDQARQTLGVDVLRLGSDDDGNTTVGAGSYLTEDVYVGVEQGTANQSGSVTVEVEVTDDITVETSTGADSSANVGVNWRWDY